MKCVGKDLEIGLSRDSNYELQILGPRWSEQKNLCLSRLRAKGVEFIEVLVCLKAVCVVEYLRQVHMNVNQENISRKDCTTVI